MNEFDKSKYENLGWDIEDLLDTPTDNSNDKDINEGKHPNKPTLDDLDENDNENTPIINNKITDTSLLRVNLDIINKSKSKQVNLHQMVIAITDFSLFQGSKRYSESDLGSIVSEVINEDVAPGADMIIMANGETLADRIKKKHYSKNRFKLKEIMEHAGEELNINIYKTNNELKKINLDVIKKHAIEEKKIHPHDSKAFIDKHRKKTRYEKSILKTLGITQDALKQLVSPKSILTIDEKAKLLSVASSINDKKGSRQSTKGPRISFNDINILTYLDFCRYASLRNLYYADGMKSLGSVMYRLRRLEKMGIIRNILVFGYPGIFSLTTLGKALIGSERPQLSKSHANPASLAERIYVNHVQACLFSGCLDILQQGIKYNRVDPLGNAIAGEELVPELDMVRSMSRRAFELKGGLFIKNTYPGENNNILREDWEIQWRKWENNGKSVDGPELNSPWLYILFYENGIKSSYIIPDIVVKRPRHSDGSPSSIAIEVERQLKSEDDYIEKLSAYKKDHRVYSKVIYVTASSRIAKRISSAAEKINFTNFDIVPMIDENGIVPETKSQWLL